jgi:hypothetical protein
MTNTITVSTKPAKRGRPRKARVGRPPTDWEKLSKQLQEALESSVKENNDLTKAKARIIKMAHELEKQVVGLTAVVELLEEKLDRANDSI